MKGKILVVDDWARWRERLERILKAEGYVVETALSYEESRSILSRESFDVAIVDTRLVDADENNIDGLLLLREIERQSPETSLVVITGYITRQQAKKILEDREFFFVEKKSFELKPFLEIVEKAARRAQARRQRCSSQPLEGEERL
ncbi:MAG: response regulator [Anaerolineae bacterium]